MDQIVRLEEQIISLREDMDRRHEDSRVEAHRRHAELVTRLDQINGRVGKAHDRAAGLESAVRYLKDEWTLIRARYHEMVNARQSGDPTVRVTDLRWYVAISAGSIGGVLALLRLIGKL